METTLYDQSLFGRIDIGDQPPYLILKGIDCQKCDANYSLYVHSSINGSLEAKSGSNSYSLPGKLLEFMGDEVLYESRVFYGEIFPDTLGLIWMQNTLMEDLSYERSIFLKQVNRTQYEGFLEKDFDQTLDAMVNQVDLGRCSEIQGETRTSAP